MSRVTKIEMRGGKKVRRVTKIEMRGGKMVRRVTKTEMSSRQSLLQNKIARYNT